MVFASTALDDRGGRAGRRTFTLKNAGPALDRHQNYRLEGGAVAGRIHA